MSSNNISAVWTWLWDRPYFRPIGVALGELDAKAARSVLGHIYELRLAGCTDTLALSAALAPLLATSPAFAASAANWPVSLLMSLCSAGGAAWLTFRAARPWTDQQYFESSLKLRSSIPDVVPVKDQVREGMLMGYTVDGGKPVHVSYRDLVQHLFILGQSGVGKTVSASSMMYQQMQGGGGCLFINGKSDFGAREQFWQMARLTGREADVYWIIPDTPSGSNTYNPVLHGDPDEKADGLLMLIPSTDSNPGSDHYKQEAKQALTTLIAALQRAKMAYNMIDLTVLLMSVKALQELERRLKQRAPDSEEAKNFSLFLDKFRKAPTEKSPSGSFDLDRMKNVFGGIGGRLFTFGTGSFGKVMNTYEPDVVLHEAILDNKLVYVDLPTMGKDTTARNFGRLVIADLRSAIDRIQRVPDADKPWPPYMVFADEAGSYVNDSWSRIPEQARSARVFFMPAAQTMANFQAISDELAEMIVGNAWTKVLFKIGTHATAESAADLIGMKLGVAVSQTRSQSASASIAMLRSAPEASMGDGSGIATLERMEEQYIVSPDDLKRLGRGECICTVGGSQIYHLRVPMLQVGREQSRLIGPPQVRRRRLRGPDPGLTGADFFRRVGRYLVSSELEAEQTKAEAVDSVDARERDRRDGKLADNGEVYADD